LQEMGAIHGTCACREDLCVGRSNGAAPSVLLEWEYPDEVTGFYVEAIVESTVPGTQFTPIRFNGGYLALQDSPADLHGLKRIVFGVANHQMLPLKPKFSFSHTVPNLAAVQSTSPPTDDEEALSPGRAQHSPKTKIDSEPHIGGSSGPGHYIFTPDKKAHRHSVSPNFAGESNVQILSFGKEVHVSHSAESVLFQDDRTGWDVGLTMKFLVLCKGDDRSGTLYAAYVKHELDWRHLASVSVTSAKPFARHCSQIEDFRRDGASLGHERQAQFGPAWFGQPDGNWIFGPRAIFRAEHTKAEGQSRTIANTTSVPDTCRNRLATGGLSKNDKRAGSETGTECNMGEPKHFTPDLPDLPEWFYAQHTEVDPIDTDELRFGD